MRWPWYSVVPHLRRMMTGSLTLRKGVGVNLKDLRKGTDMWDAILARGRRSYIKEVYLRIFVGLKIMEGRRTAIAA